MKDANPRMRIQAIRASETLYKAGDRTFDADYRALAVDKDVNVAIQALLTLNYLKAPNVAETVRAAQAASTARGVQEIGNQILKPPTSAFGRGGRGGPPPFTPAELAVMERGEAIYKEVCFACHGDDGRGTAQPGAAPGTTMAPSLANSVRLQGHRDYVIKTLLHGMDGPIEGRSYAAGVMAPMGTNRDEWIAAIASYTRNSFGNVGTFVSPADVARVRAATADRKSFWKVDELVASLPVPLEVLPTWKASASHNTATALGALNFASWTSGAPQQPGMWFQIELPEAVTVTELQFNSAGGGFGGGGRGRGAVPAGAGAAVRRQLRWCRPGPIHASSRLKSRRTVRAGPALPKGMAHPVRRPSRSRRRRRNTSVSRKREPLRMRPFGPCRGSGYTGQGQEVVRAKMRSFRWK